MNFFASDVFLGALASDFYRATDFRFRTYTISGYSVRLAEINGKKPLVDGPFYDYVKPLPSPQGGDGDGHVRFIPKVVTSTVLLDDRNPGMAWAPTGQEPAPLVAWARFPTWAEYESFLHGRSKDMLKVMRKRRAKLAREHVAATYTFDDRNRGALELLCDWKRKQYQGGNETLENPRAVAMLRHLFDDGNLLLATLKVGDRYVAIHAGFIWDNEYLALIPAFDPAFAQYGVGKQLLLYMLQDSHQRGHSSFDFLQGAESYKFDFATHLQIIEPLGSPPLAYRVRRHAKTATKAALLRISPRLFHGLKRTILATRRLRHMLNPRNRRSR